MIVAQLRPRGPYSLRLSARHASDATRRVRDGVFTATIAAGGELEQVRAWQRPDGASASEAASEAGVEHVRFVLALDDDHSEFLRRFANDPLLGGVDLAGCAGCGRCGRPPSRTRCCARSPAS